MGKLRSFILVVALSIPSLVAQLNCSGGCGGANVILPQIVQAVSGARNSLTAVFLNNVISGDILIISVGWETGANTASSIADTLSTSWTKITELTGNANENIALYVGKASSSGPDTITATFPSGATNFGVYAGEFAGGTLTQTVDGSASVRGATATTSIAITTATAGDLIFLGAQGDQSGGLWLQGSGLIGAGFSNGADSGAIFIGVQTAAGLIGAKPITNSANNVAFAMAGFKHP
jgi:hypothetical protein